jgi:tape measure domain-containing protein
MGKTVDDRVVAMSFENAKFEANAAKTISTLDRLKQSLHLGGASKGLQDVAVASDKLKSGMRFDGAVKSLDGISAATRRVNFGSLTGGIETVKASFSALQVAGVAALSTIVSKATTAGLDIAKSLTIAPVAGGLREYETKLNSIQTILANTQASGATLGDVSKALNELNEYSDKTIYNFGEMAKNIGTFTAAGVDLKTATGSIKGIANLAALSGSNSQQASTAMYQLSQAISSGRVSLQDWNSVVNAGMGGTVFQRALAQTAEQMGTLSEGAVKLKGKMKNVSIEGKSFRESIQAGPGKTSWLTSDVLTKTLQQFTGDLSNAELAAQGFNQAQIKAIQAQAKTAQEAATKVKTFSQLLSTARETSESGWSQTYELIFGNFTEARSLFTGASNALNGVINNSANARNAVIKDWKDLGGRTALIQSIKNVFAAAAAVLKPIKEAFREFFPAKTGQELFNITKAFEKFTKSLIPGAERVMQIKRIFAGVFAVFSIGRSIITEIFGVFKKLFGIAGDGSGGFLELIATIADFIVSIDIAIRQSTSFGEVFDKLGDILAKPIILFGKLASAIGGLFSGGGSGGGGGGSSLLVTILDGLAKAALFVIDVFGKLGDAIGEAFGNVEFNDVVDAITVGLLGGILLAVKNFIKEFKVDISGGLLGEISGSFNQLTGTLKTMQRGIQADTLMKIAIAVGILVVSVVALSKIDGESLSKSLSALGVAFGMLLVAMGIIAKISATGGFIKVPLLAASMILLAVAIDALVVAVFALSKLSWEELAKGLTGVAVLLAAISAASIPLSANSGGMVRAGIGILAISIALKVLASAVKDFGNMDWATIGKGLVGVAGALVAVGLAMMFVPPNIALTGIGLIAVAVGLKGLAAAIKTFGGMDLAATGKGLGIIVAAIVALGVAVSFLPKTLALQAAGLVLLSVALGGIAAAIALMGSLSLGTLAKGLAALAGSMAILAVGLNAMRGTLTGSASLVIAAAALALLVPPMLLLGQQSWGSIVKGLVSLAGAFVVLGVAGVFIGPLAPAILALGASLVVAGAGMLLFGAGVALLGTGLASLVIVGPAAIGILVKMFIELAKIMPKVALELGKAIVVLIKTVAAAAPQIAVAVGQLITAMLNAIIINAPKIGQAFLVLLTTAVNTIRVAFPMLVTAGLDMLVSLLRGLGQNIGRITTAAANVVINFLKALTDKLPELVDAGAKFLIKLLEGISKNIGKITKKAVEIVTKFLKAIATKLPDFLDAGADVIKAFLDGIAKNAKDITAKAAKVVAEFIKGLGKGAKDIVVAGGEAVASFIEGLGSAASDIAIAGLEAIVTFVETIEANAQNFARRFTEAGIGIGKAIGAGVAQGIISSIPGINAAVDRIGGIVGRLRATLKTGQGLLKGIQGLKLKTLNINPDDLADSVVNAFASQFQILKGLKSILAELDSVYSSADFANGLKESAASIDETFTNLNASTIDTLTNIRNEIDGFKDEIKTLQEAKKDYWAKKEKDRTKKDTKDFNAAKTAIKDYKTQITAYNKAFQKILAGRKALVASVNPIVTSLNLEIKNRDDLIKKLDKEKAAYDALISARDSFASGVLDQFTTLPTIDNSEENAGGQLGKYQAELGTLVTDTEAYIQTLDRLRAIGLDDTTYRMLLSQGVSGKKFADQLLNAGPTVVASINGLNSRLQTAAQTVSDTAVNSLYQVGINAKEALIKGLTETDIPESNRKIDAFVQQIIDRVKKKFKIKSPSRVFAEIGKFTAEGLIVGLKSQTGNVTAMAERLGTGLSEALANSLAATVDFDPVIKPVLDLSDIQNSAKRLGDLGTVSYGYATDISAAQMKSLEEAAQAATTPKEIQLVQNNYSPEALTAAEIYRQTNNQLSRAKALASV